MQYRALWAIASALAVTSSALGSYLTGMYFKNETTGTSVAGGVPVRPGDLVSMNFFFHRTSGDTTSRWTALNVFVDLAPPEKNAILTDAEANTWDAYLRQPSIFGDTSKYLGVLTWQPSDGPIHDNAVDPSDPTSALVTTKGIFAEVLSRSSSVYAGNIDIDYFQFHVGPAAVVRSEFHWDGEGATGIGTGLDTLHGTNEKITYNWLVVVPEPGSVAAGIGVLSLFALRRKKGR